MPLHRDIPSPITGRLAVIFGILASQVAATVLVRRANLALYKEMTAIIEKGYVAVPSAPVVKGLTGWLNAFMGGIFFTATLGVLLTLFTLAAVRLLRRRRWSLFRQALTVAAIWSVLAVFLNGNGLNGGATAYVSAVMATVAAAGFFFHHGPARREPPFRRALIVAAPLLLLTGLWLTRLDKDLFVDIRDRLLFSNPVGVKIVEFYYDYTLFAAQAMAPLSQRTLIGLDMSAMRGDIHYGALSEALRRSDVLDIGAAPGAAAVLTPEGAAIRWQDPAGRFLLTSRNEILADPGAVAAQFSRAVDRNAPFRLLVLAGILVGFPVMLYLSVFAVMEALMGCIAGRHAAVCAALSCLVIGAVLFYPLAAAPDAGRGGSDLMALWSDGKAAGRISVLKQAAQKGLDPLVYPDADALSHSAGLAERYWFARALAGARSDRGFELLSRMMHDPSPLVICQVGYAFGEMSRQAAIPILRRYLANGGYWYAQRYAYAALKKLGWAQPPPYR